MVNLTEIKQRIKTYIEDDNELLFIGVYKDKKLSPNQRKLDLKLEKKLYNAIALESFIG